MTDELPPQRRLLFSFILAGFVLVVIEAGCQVFYRFTAGDFLFRRTSAPIFAADPTRCYRLKSNLDYVHRTNEFEISIYTNSQGMRTDSRRLDPSPEKPPDVYRTLFLGPSFTFGWGNSFEDSYPTLIGELLRAEGKRVEVINMGTPAQGLALQMCWLEEHAAELQLDMVVQTVYGDRVVSAVGECPERLECPVIEDSRLYMSAPTLERKLIAQLKNLGTVFYAYYAYQWLLGVVPPDDAGTGKELHSSRARRKDGDHGALAADYHRYERLVHRTLGERVEVAFLFIPMSYVVHPADAPRWSHLLDADPAASRERIYAAASALRDDGIALIDPTEVLVRRGGDERLYYWLDIHLNPAGNRLVAKTAAAALAELMGPRHR